MQNNKLRVLVIGAHPDDCELRVGGTAVKFRKLGHIVKFVSVTNGCTGHHVLDRKEVSKRRAEEFENSCKITGIESQVFDIDSNSLEADIETREKVIRLIREFRPDLIITHRPNDYHPDHRRTGTLVQDSSYAVRVPSVCPDTPCLNYPPIILYMYDNFKNPSPFTPDIAVDVDDVYDIKLRMIDCHESQLYEWLPWVDGILDQVPTDADSRFEWLKERQLRRDRPVADNCRDKLIELYGVEHGSRIECAEAFEVSEYGGKLPAEKIADYFPFFKKCDS